MFQTVRGLAPARHVWTHCYPEYQHFSSSSHIIFLSMDWWVVRVNRHQISSKFLSHGRGIFGNSSSKSDNFWGGKLIWSRPGCEIKYIRWHWLSEGSGLLVRPAPPAPPLVVGGGGLQTISYDRKLSLFDCDNSPLLSQQGPVNKFCFQVWPLSPTCY